MEKEQNSLKDSFGIISKELAESRAHLEREEERVEYEKNDFANKLKNGFGAEIKAVLAEKEAIEKSSRQVSGLTAAKNELESIGWFGLLKAMTNSREPLILCT